MGYKSPPIGNQIVAVFYDIPLEKLEDVNKLKEVLISALEGEDFEILDVSEKKFEPQGWTIFCLLAESHATIHTYPEHNSCYFEIYSCRGENDGIKTYQALKDYFNKKDFFSKFSVVVGPKELQES